MSIRKPLFSIISSAPQQKKAPTFGAYRAERMSERLNKAIIERRTLSRAEAVADNPLDIHLGNRGTLVGNKIGRLQQEISAQKKETETDE